MIPFHYDPRVEDWSEYLYLNSRDRFVSLPVESVTEILPDLYVGARGFCTGGKFLKVLEDLGCIELRREKEWIETFGTDNLRRFRRFMKRENRAGFHQVCSYVVLDDVPDWIRDVLTIPTPGWIQYDRNIQL